MYSLIVRALKALGFSLGTGGAGIDAASITSGTIDAARLPSYVDDVVEYANLAAFPGTGTTGKIYVALDTGIQYRWTGSAYVDIAALKFNVAGDTLTGTGGAGFFGAIPQSSKPSTPASGFRLFANSGGKLAWIGTNGFLRVFDGTANTADRTYTLPDSDGTVVVDTTFATVGAATIHAATSKATPVDADELALVDSAASNAIKKLTWANLKATLKTYFDGLYGSQMYKFASGYYYTFLSAPSDTTAALSIGVACGGAYFPVSVATTFDRIGVEITGAVASSTVRLGIYNIVNSLPTTLVLDAGTVDSSTTGAKEITISQTLQPGLYLLLAAPQTGASAVGMRARLGGYGIPLPQAAISNSNYTGWMSSIEGAFPNSPSWSISQAAQPKVMLRAA